MVRQVSTRDEVREGLTAALKTWVEDGVKKPMIPSYRDGDNDGAPDYYALNSFGNLVIIDKNDSIFAEYTDVSISTGEGVEGHNGNSD